MNKDEKNTIMQQFSCGEVNVLVATTVIEVGVQESRQGLVTLNLCWQSQSHHWFALEY
jgi:RecG-like helicase